MTIRDETVAGEATGSIVLDVPGTVTLRELIRLRVREEVARHNAHATTRVGWERQADSSVAAFERNGFFVFVGDRQVDDLDEELSLDEASSVAFVRLVPLVGG